MYRPMTGQLRRGYICMYSDCHRYYAVNNGHRYAQGPNCGHQKEAVILISPDNPSRPFSRVTWPGSAGSTLVLPGEFIQDSRAVLISGEKQMLEVLNCVRHSGVISGTPRARNPPVNGTGEGAGPALAQSCANVSDIGTPFNQRRASRGCFWSPGVCP